MEIEQAKQIWAELIEEVKNAVGERRLDEITIAEFSDMSGVSLQIAREFLEARVRKGILKKRKIYLLDVGSTCNLYSPV